MLPPVELQRVRHNLATQQQEQHYGLNCVIYWSPNPQVSQNMALFEGRIFTEIMKWKWGHEVLTQYDGDPDKKGKSGHRDTRRRKMRLSRPSASRGERPGADPSLQAIRRTWTCQHLDFTLPAQARWNSLSCLSHHGGVRGIPAPLFLPHTYSCSTLISSVPSSILFSSKKFIIAHITSTLQASVPHHPEYKRKTALRWCQGSVDHGETSTANGTEGTTGRGHLSGRELRQ